MDYVKAALAYNAQLLKAMPYEDYLKTDHWQRTRRRAIQRQGGQCQLCRSTENLVVHHLSYERKGQELPSDLEVLCARCHRRIHGRLP